MTCPSADDYRRMAKRADEGHAERIDVTVVGGPQAALNVWVRPKHRGEPHHVYTVPLRAGYVSALGLAAALLRKAAEATCPSCRSAGCHSRLCIKFDPARDPHLLVADQTHQAEQA